MQVQNSERAWGLIHKAHHGVRVGRVHLNYCSMVDKQSFFECLRTRNHGNCINILLH
jgi:hypothetical protein